MHPVVLHLDELEPCTPQLPHRRFAALTPLAASAALHVTLAVAAFLIQVGPQPDSPSFRTRATPEQQLTDIVFLAPASLVGAGGGGGGNQQSEPIRRAQAVGSDAITLRTRKTPPTIIAAPPAARPAIENPALPSIVLDAKPLASGAFDQLGLPTGELVQGTSTGPGFWGGVGTGIGTGLGSGRGPGLGPGSGGGTGGGVYHAGGAVSAPRLIKEVRPRYTSEALRNMTQGTVVLDVVVARDGCTSQIRVVRSLDPGGLDEEAVSAVAQWRFEPGRLAGAPVDVLVTIMLDFTIR
jgi:TonB family protein